MLSIFPRSYSKSQYLQDLLLQEMSGLTKAVQIPNGLFNWPTFASELAFADTAQRQAKSTQLSPRQHYCSGSRRPTNDIKTLDNISWLMSTRTQKLLVPSTCRSTLGDRVFPVAATRVWNSLPPQTRATSSILTFRRETKSHLFRQWFGCSVIFVLIYFLV